MPHIERQEDRPRAAAGANERLWDPKTLGAEDKELEAHEQAADFAGAWRPRPLADIEPSSSATTFYEQQEVRLKATYSVRIFSLWLALQLCSS